MDYRPGAEGCPQRGLRLRGPTGAPEPTGARILHSVLQHASLEVPPHLVRDCVAFWELLGFEEMEPPPLLGGRFTWVQREGTQIHLIPVEQPVNAAEGHVAVVAPDYDHTVRLLLDAGFDLRAGVNAWNAPRCFVRSPGGNLVEVMSKPPQPPFPSQ
jgi:catechol 2,3-dioxygenase-like lactoylglutathione lyase family enzyme